MKYSISTLKNLDEKTLLNVYNLSYEGKIPAKEYDEKLFTMLLLNDNIELDLSAGAFDESGNLKGFLLIGFGKYDGKITGYISGIGVLPDARDRDLAKQMFNYILPILKKEGITQLLLEVTESNQIAYKVFLDLGFRPQKNMICYGGSIQRFTYDGAVDVKILVDRDWKLFESFWSYYPSWKNGMAAVEKLIDYVFIYGAFINNQLIGYIVYNPVTKEALQLAVEPESRHKGVAKALIHHVVNTHSRDMYFWNVDKTAISTQTFISELGLKQLAIRKEMILPLID